MTRLLDVTTELHARLLDEASAYDPAAHTRSLLAPYRDVLLLQRAKFMSYEQIAGLLTRHGLRVSPAGVGQFCRRTFSKAEILRKRREIEAGPAPGPDPVAKAPATKAPAPAPRGPKIARDDF